MKPIDIAPADLETVRCILREHTPGLEVRAFGSRVSWTARETSDLDIALLTDEPLSTARMTNLKAAFTKSYLPFRVDIVDWASTSESFRRVIESEHVVLVEHKVEPDYEEWQTLLLGKCANLSRDNVSPSELKDAIYIGLEHIGENTLSLVGYGSANDVKSAKTRFQNGDILFGKLRPYFRKVVLVNFDGICSTDIWVIRASEGIHQRFLFYNIASQSLVDFATLTSEGTHMPRAKWNYLSEYELKIPTYSHQCAIASILGALDDKIELNHRMNKTLEEIAQALFKSWFVDFEPVRAKLAVLENGGTTDEAEQAAMCTISGNDEITLAKLQIEQPDAYAKIAQIASKFPSAMQNSKLGGIPKGWQVKVLSCFGDIVTGKTPSTKELKHFGDDVPFLRIPDMHEKIYVLQTKMMLSNHGASSQPKKTLPPGSTSVSCIATPGLVVLNHRAVQTNQQINSIVPKDRALSRYIFWSCRHLSSEIKIGGIGGSVYSNMKKSAFGSLPVLDVGLEIVRVFDQLISPLHDTILSNEIQSHVLAQLRDTLLPKLVSGKLQIENAKR